MCGIAGILVFNKESSQFLEQIEAATECLSQRGPDDKGIFKKNTVALGHRRLSIIDTSHAAAQPMSDANGRYHIVFNGEFFNYAFHRKKLEQEGVVFQTHSDTEVLLNLYMREGPSCLEKVNGFFALAIYDSVDETLFIARDRMGVKPLVYYFDNDKLCFASELKSLLAMGIKKELNYDALHLYFQLNYLPPDVSILKNVKKLGPGAYLFVSMKKKQEPEEVIYYSIPFKEKVQLPVVRYDDACRNVSLLLDEAVQRRLVSDVPLGAFLSGGLDSSIIVALASKHVKGLNTFSVGFKDDPHFDETRYASLVADLFKTNHHTFKLKTDDLLGGLFDMLNYMDEPFADSSALNVYILSRETRKYVTVALSGDGADELFGGYQKHKAEWILQHQPAVSILLKSFAPVLKNLEGSRNSPMANKLRQVQRFSSGARLTSSERYWQWCCIADNRKTNKLVKTPISSRYDSIKGKYINSIDEKDFNTLLKADMQLVLPGDMLVKVDMMSMANSLEVRNPFIDKDVVNYAFSLPDDYKIDKKIQKKIIRDAFKEVLPAEIINRSKRGFEVPLIRWFKHELKSLITDDLLSDAFIQQQAIFNLSEVQKLKSQLFSSHPGDVAARIWALIVFQYWYKRYFLN